jgi:predicted GNAT superfamily acetyltransferase
VSRIAGAINVEVRPCHGLDQFRACMAVERRVWGSSDLEVPLPIYVVAAETGGQVLGAFAGAEVVGFTLAMPGVRPDPKGQGAGQPYLHSHMTAVLPEWRGRKIGLALKLAQREEALARGIRLVEWTFDPLETRNARLNLVRLGAIARRFIPNCYGITASLLHAGLPTDRLMTEWQLDAPRVAACLAGNPPQPAHPVRIDLPYETDELRRSQPATARELQARLEKEFDHWLGRGYAATSFEISGDRAAYLLEPWRGEELVGAACPP